MPGRTWAEDGFFPGQVIRVSNTKSADLDGDDKADNDGEYVVASVDGLVLKVKPDVVFVPQRHVEGVSIRGFDGNVVLRVDASVDLKWTAKTPFFRDKSSEGELRIGNASIKGDEVRILSNSTTKKFAEFAMNHLASGNSPGFADGLMSDGTFPEFVDGGVDPVSGVARPDVITRDSGSWIADGFTPGQTILVENTTLNDGFHVILAVSDTVLTLGPTSNLRSELGNSEMRIETVRMLQGDPGLDFIGDDAGNRITRLDGVNWADQGFEKGQSITVSGTTDGADEDALGDNDGIFTIVDIQGSTLVLEEAADFVTQRGLRGIQLYTQGSPGKIAMVMVDPDVKLRLLEILLTFRDNGASGDSITRSEGSWTADLFAPGQSVLVQGTRLNDGDYPIASISADGRTLILGPGVELRNEQALTGPRTDVVAVAEVVPSDAGVEVGLVFSRLASTIRRTDGVAWSAAGFIPGLTIIVTGTLLNDGAYRIESISPDGSTLTVWSTTPLEDEDTTAYPEGTDPGLDNEIFSAISLANPTIRFSGDRIERSSGSWTEDGFVVGGRFLVEGSSSNDDQYEIGAIENEGRTLRIRTNSYADGTPNLLAEETGSAIEFKGILELRKPEDEGGALINAGEIGESLLLKIVSPLSILSKFLVQGVVQESESSIRVDRGASIDSVGGVEIVSTSKSHLVQKTESLWLGLTYGKSEASAETVVADGVEIVAGGNVKIGSFVDNKVNVATKVVTGLNKKALLAMRVSQVIKPALIPGPAFAATMGEGSSDARTIVGGPSTVIEANGLQVLAENRNDFIVLTKAKVNGLVVANTGFSATASISDFSSNAISEFGGTSRIRADARVHAESIALNNDTDSRSIVKRDPYAGSNKYSAKANSEMNKALFGRNFYFPIESGSFSAAAAFAIADSENEAVARLTRDARIFARNSVDVTAFAEDNHKSIAIGKSKTLASNSLGGALVISDYENIARDEVADGATVAAGGQFLVDAESVIPNQIALDELFLRLINPPKLYAPRTQPIDASDPLSAATSAVDAATTIQTELQENASELISWGLL